MTAFTVNESMEHLYSSLSCTVCVKFADSKTVNLEFWLSIAVDGLVDYKNRLYVISITNIMFWHQERRSNPMQSVGISGSRTSMAVEGNQQADLSGLGSDIISEDNLNVDSEIVNLSTGMTLEENVGTDTSSLASVEKLINVSERNNAVSDASTGIVGVEMIQQADVSDLRDVLPSSENLNDNPELRKDDVREDARGCDASEMLSPMKGENGDDNTPTNVPRNVTEVTDTSKVLSPKKGGDTSLGINITTVETEESGACRKLYPAKGEDGDSSEKISRMQDQDDDAEIRTNKSMDKGGLGLNSPCVLSKCSFAADGTLSASENIGQRESKRLAELRDRKRSKYLSPPYVNLSKGSKGSNQENSAASVVKEGSDLNGSSKNDASKSGSKRKKRKLSIKPVVSSAKLQDISASSGELLSELHLADLDCLYPSEKKHFDPTELFFTIFRSSVFQLSCFRLLPLSLTD
ncbi:hypothetical protein KSS87_018950 [Heliosperma pusillum]|nr:hypothetical protein KSS87_018950 [Heliosperma pusillum]